jgi:ligand-binding sensor domain-containing protein
MRVKALAIKPTATSTLFAATYGGGVFTSSNSGAAWSACAAQPTNQNVLTLAMHSNGKLYAGTEAGVFVSSDDCANWAALNTGMP